MGINNFSFSQNGAEIKIPLTTVHVNLNYDLEIAVDSNKFSSSIKTLVLKIKDPFDSEKTSAYNFSSSTNGFKLTVPKFSKEGNYSFTVEGYDSDNNLKETSEGFLTVKAYNEDSSIFSPIISFFSEGLNIFYTAIPALAIVAIWLIFKKRKNDVDKYKIIY